MDLNAFSVRRIRRVGGSRARARVAMRTNGANNACASSTASRVRGRAVFASSRRRNAHSGRVVAMPARSNGIARRRRWTPRTSAMDAKAVEELLTDSALGAACYWVSDELAQRLARRTHATETAEACELPTSVDFVEFVRDDRRRARYVAFGAVDGATAYVWYDWVDWVVPDDPSRAEYVTTALKVAVDAAVYNPLWAVFFIAAMGAMSAHDSQKIVEDVKRDWRELYVNNCTFWVPMDFIIYGVTPLEYRVALLYALNVVYVCALSMFQEREMLAKDSGDSFALTDVVARVLPDDVRADWRDLTGCPRCEGERFVECELCSAATRNLIDPSRATTVNCEACSGARRIPCPECTVTPVSTDEEELSAV